VRKLPLTLFEEYLFHENRPNYPCNIWLRAQFRGPVERDRLKQAIEWVTPKHPLLTAQIETGWLGSLRWVIDPTREIAVHWHREDPDTYRPECGDFDLRNENGFEFHIVEGENRWDLYINQSHAICDGAGFYLVLHEVLLRYDAISRSQPAACSTPPSDTLPRYRSRYGLNTWKALALVPAQLMGLLISTTLLRRKVGTLNPNVETKLNHPLPPGAPHLVSNYLSKSEYFDLRKAARESKFSLNDLCLAFFQSAIGKWRAEEGIDSPSDWIRISIPVNLRTKADKSLSACNAISIVSIDRKAHGLENRKRLLRRAKEDMKFVKRGQLAFVYLIILWIRRIIPEGIRRMSHSDTCRTTAMFTNLGHIFTHSPLRQKDGKLHSGKATLVRMTSAAPYRPHSHATLLVSVYAGEFEISLHYDPRALTHAQAQSLVDHFKREIRKGV